MGELFLYLIVLLLFLSSFVLIWQFTGYPIFMAMIALKAKPSVKDYTFQPGVSIIVPTFNEERSIKKRIENLLSLNYPKDKYDIIIVDSGSKDSTVQIVNDFLIKNKEKTPVIQLVTEEERKGKASAINFGKKFSKQDIILVTDANCIFDPDVLKEMMPNFKDPRVGAVGGRYFVLDPSNSITESTQFYWDLEYIMRIGEDAIDSACLFHGEINAWRKNLIHTDVRLISEDLDMAIRIRKKGYKIKYEPDAAVYEPAPATARDQIKQRKRTSIGTIQAIFKHFKYLMVPKDLYSLFIFPSHKFITMVSPFYLIIIPLLYLVSGNFYLVISHVLLTLLVFIISLAILMHLKAKICARNIGRFSFSSLFKIVNYVLLNEYLIILAWVDFASGKYTVLWEKAETTRSID